MTVCTLAAFANASRAAGMPFADRRAPTPAPSASPDPALADPDPLSPVASQAPQPSASPSPRPAPTWKFGPHRRSTSTATARPTAGPSPIAAPVVAPAATPSGGASPVADGPPETPIPTQAPTPRPVAPIQPTIPDSMSDPNVRSIISRPIRELSQVAWMQGTWRATGSYELSDGSSKKLDPTTWVFAPVLNNRWLFGADGRSQDYLYLTFDPFLRRWTALRFATNPAYGIWISDRGWVDNRIDFVTNFSYANGRQYRRRLTIIRKDARTFGIYETEQLPDGTWTPDDAVELTRKG